MKVHTPRSRIAASADTPWFGVHVLTEFIYCERAGLLAFERAKDEPYEEQVNLRYLPEWSLSEIQRHLRVTLIRLALVLVVALCLSLVCLGCYHAEADSLCWLAGAGAFGFGWLAWRQLRDGITLFGRLRAARRAAPAMPKEDTTVCQPVCWWSLLRAGFDSVKYKDSLKDERLRLSGRPWRVLRKGSLRIPVFRLQGEPRLKRQHFARMAAYCHLLETCEGGHSPYGVVIFAGTYDGTTVPNSPASRKAFHDGLVKARSTLQRNREGSQSRHPVNLNLCAGCPHGYPQVQVSRWFRPVKGYPRRGVDGRLYRSSCGDRYRWTPPHEKAIRKRLV